MRISNGKTAIVFLFVICSVSFLDTRRSLAQPAPKACEWNQEEVLVIPGTISDKEQKALDKLLDALEKAVGGAIPQIGAVKTAIDKLGPGKDVVDVVVIYTCTDNAGKINRKRATLDGQTEAVLWAAKMNLVKGSAKANRDRERQKAINNHKPKTSCCPPKAPPAGPGGTKDPGPQPPVTPPVVQSPCKPPPPCKECMPIHARIVAKCDRLEAIPGEIRDLTDELAGNANRQEYARREIAEAEEKGATAKAVKAKGELKTLEKEAETIKANSNNLRAEPGKLQTELKDLAVELKTCEKDRCGKTVTGPPAAGGIDKCLIGTWRSQSIKTLDGLHGEMFGGGIVLVIKADGSVSIDYEAMEPKKVIDVNGREVSKQTWRGKAAGKISTKDTAIVVDSIESSALTRESTLYGNTQTNKISGLGIVFLSSAPYTLNYTCNANALTLQASAFGMAFEKYEFTKEK